MRICEECFYWVAGGCHAGIPEQQQDSERCIKFSKRPRSILKPLATVVQIQASIIVSADRNSGSELLTLLYSDGMIVKGNCAVGSTRYNWRKIIPPNPNELEE